MRQGIISSWCAPTGVTYFRGLPTCLQAIENTGYLFAESNSRENMKKLILMILALSLAKIAMAGAYDEVLNPPTYTKSECEAMQDAVWVDASWQEEGVSGIRNKRASACVRYFPSDNAAGASTALLVLDGDVYSNIATDAANYEVQKAGHTVLANRVAEQTDLPVIRIARPGTFGSSGMSHVRDRRMPVETYLVDAAVTKIKERYGYQRVHLAGHSGGGSLVGALMTFGRSDIGCAVVSSGVVSIKTRSSHLNTPNFRQGRDETGNSLGDVYDPIDHVSTIAPDENRRIFVLGDPRDETVSFASQQEFHEKLVSSGISSTLLVGEANDPKHHALGIAGQRVAGWCQNGKSGAEIQELLKSKNVSNSKNTTV